MVSFFYYFSFSTIKLNSLIYFSILSSFTLELFPLAFSSIPLSWKSPLLRQISVTTTTSSEFLVRSILSLEIFSNFIPAGILVSSIPILIAPVL